MTFNKILMMFLLIISFFLLIISSFYLYMGIYDELYEQIEKNKLWFGIRSESILPLIILFMGSMIFIIYYFKKK